MTEDDKYEWEDVHKSMIRPGDIILERGKLRTLSSKDISRDAFMGITIRGSSYNLGQTPVSRVKRKEDIPY